MVVAEMTFEATPLHSAGGPIIASSLTFVGASNRRTTTPRLVSSIAIVPLVWGRALALPPAEIRIRLLRTIARGA